MADLIGQRLGQYEVIAQLGQGGMATVYRARQTSIKRDVAIKVIKPEMIEAGGIVERFQREAETVASLSHLHILKVFDYGQQDGLLYLVMELLTGGSLSELIQKGPLPLPKATRMIDQIAQALDYAHMRGIIHRDLKPQNVLLDQDENAYLTDFGIAKLVNAKSTMTQTGAVMGTPAYMAPEQWSGGAIDARTDLYALGIMLYQMLTGTLPYNGDTPFRVMHMHIYEQPQPAFELNPMVPRGVEKVLLKAIAKKPEDRYESAVAMVDAFKAALQGKEANVNVVDVISVGAPAVELVEINEIPPMPSGLLIDTSTKKSAPTLSLIDAKPVEAALPTKRSSPFGLIIGLVAIVALLGIGVVVLSSRNQNGGAVALVPSAISSATSELDQTATQHAQATLLAIAAASSTATLTPTTAITDTPPPTMDMHQTVIAAIAATGTSVAAAATTPSTSTPLPSATLTPTITPIPPSQKIAFTTNRDGNSEIYVMNADGTNPINLTKNRANDTSPAWSLDGRKIAFTTYRDGEAAQIYVMNADGSNPVDVSTKNNFDAEPNWSPDGKKIVFYSGRYGSYQIVIMNADGTNPVRLTNNQASDTSPVFSPDGKQIAFISNRDNVTQVYVMNADGTNQRRLTDSGTGSARPYWSPDGKRLVFASKRGSSFQVYTMNAADGSNIQALTSGTAASSFPAWSPDGNLIAYVSGIGIAPELYILNVATSKAIRLTNTHTGESFPAFQPSSS